MAPVTRINSPPDRNAGAGKYGMTPAGCASTPDRTGYPRSGGRSGSSRACRIQSNIAVPPTPIVTNQLLLKHWSGTDWV